MSLERPLESLSDDDLLRGLTDLLRQSHRVEADLVAHLAEVEARRLYAREASPSMFVYCTDVLHLSEAEAYLRIAASLGLGGGPISTTSASCALRKPADGRARLRRERRWLGTGGIGRGHGLRGSHLRPSRETSVTPDAHDSVRRGA
jgi:hypothetical protein